ncbi:hypothetical protein HDV00_012783 [Rhizophlyctis rosea]|nr:hypothetical protein HDV00_012783 [Rhizophlyctis rosea]
MPSELIFGTPVQLRILDTPTKMTSADDVLAHLKRAICQASEILERELLECFEELDFKGKIFVKGFCNDNDIELYSPIDNILNHTQHRTQMLRLTEQKLAERSYKVRIVFLRKYFHYDGRVKKQVPNHIKRIVWLLCGLTLFGMTGTAYFANKRAQRLNSEPKVDLAAPTNIPVAHSRNQLANRNDGGRAIGMLRSP